MDTTESFKNNKTKGSCNDFGCTFRSYSSKSTPHGVSYLSDEEASGFERILWGVIVLLGLAFTIFQLIILFEEWQDSPTVTTLNTSFFPVKEIKFPQVTICPQGSVNNLVERVLFKQLTKFIKENSFRTEGHNKPWNLTEEKVNEGIKTFLHNMYPNAKDTPSKYVRLLTSKNPQMLLEADAILNAGNESNCDENHDKAFVKNINEQLNARKCPIGFELVDEHFCIHISDHQMPFEDAASYCAEKSAEDLTLTEINFAVLSTNLKEGAGTSMLVLVSECRFF